MVAFGWWQGFLFGEFRKEEGKEERLVSNFSQFLLIRAYNKTKVFVIGEFLASTSLTSDMPQRGRVRRIPESNPKIH